MQNRETELPMKIWESWIGKKWKIYQPKKEYGPQKENDRYEMKGFEREKYPILKNTQLKTFPHLT